MEGSRKKRLTTSNIPLDATIRILHDSLDLRGILGSPSTRLERQSTGLSGSVVGDDHVSAEEIERNPTRQGEVSFEFKSFSNEKEERRQDLLMINNRVPHNEVRNSSRDLLPTTKRNRPEVSFNFDEDFLSTSRSRQLTCSAPKLHPDPTPYRPHRPGTPSLSQRSWTGSSDRREPLR